MAALRFLGFLCVLVATIALVSDVTLSGTRNRPALLTPASVHWSDLSPGTLVAAQKAVRSATHPLVWDVVARPVLGLPSAVLFAGLGGLLFFIGRRRRRVVLYTN
jgi:hypothetical protein